MSDGTFNPPFELIRKYLSDKPTKRPARRITHEQLKRIAKNNPPSNGWLRDDPQEDCPFE